MPLVSSRTPRRARSLALGVRTPIALAVCGSVALALLGFTAASQARSLALNESGQLRLTSKHGFTLNEQGTASGTVPSPIYVHLTIASTSRVSAEVSLYPHGGSISGYASASYHRGSETASFSGTLSIDRGSGSYARAHGSGLSFSGTIARANDAIIVHVSGTATD